MQNKKNKSSSVTILLPANNEEAVIGDTVISIKKLYPEFEVLVIDDGSNDNTIREAVNAGAHVWPHPYNIGNGAAIKTGLRLAQNDWIIMMDADGQHRPEDIEALLEHIDTYDMVVGARTKDSETKWYRNVANSLYNKIASYVTRFKVEDLTSGFRMVRASTVKQFIYLLPNTFSYPSTLTMAYLRSGRSVKYVPIQTKYRVGKSKIRLFEDGVRFLLIIVKIATFFAPLRIFLPISLFFLFSGLSYYCYTFITSGRFTNMSMLLLNTSIIVFLMGLVSEQISQMRFDRVK